MKPYLSEIFIPVYIYFSKPVRMQMFKRPFSPPVCPLLSHCEVLNAKKFKNPFVKTKVPLSEWVSGRAPGEGLARVQGFPWPYRHPVDSAFCEWVSDFFTGEKRRKKEAYVCFKPLCQKWITRCELFNMVVYTGDRRGGGLVQFAFHESFSSSPQVVNF